jgi:hypothetical protein
VDYKHERAWALSAKQSGIRVGFLGTTSTHMPEVFQDAGDFVIRGEAETACIELASGKELSSRVPSTPTDLDSLPVPLYACDRWRSSRCSCRVGSDSRYVEFVVHSQRHRP